MATYKIDTPDGHSYDIEAENDQQAQSAIQSYLPSNDPGLDVNKTVSNIIPDIKQMVQGAGATASTWAPFMGGDVASVLPGLAKQGVEMLSHPKETAQSLVRPIAHPIDYLQEHPVQQALNVLGAGQLAAKGAGMALNAMPFTENIVPTIERIANNQTLKGFGGSMGQLKQMEEGSGGRAALDEAARFARANNLSDVLTTDIGREKALESLLSKSGETLGKLREEAGTATPNIISKILENPKAKMEKYLGEGIASKQLPMADLALKDIKEIGGTNPTHKSLADAATYINQTAAGEKLYQPINAATDIANALSDENNQQIAQSLGSQKAKQYVDALKQQQELHPLEHLHQKGELRQAGGRGGIGLAMVQKLADEFGYRLSAKTAAAVHDTLAGDLGATPKIAVGNLVSNLVQKSSNPINSIGQNPQARDILMKVLQKLRGTQQ